jgi:hypothetical protein
MERKSNLSWTLFLAVILLGGVFFFASCEKYAIQEETVNPEQPVSFADQIQPIFTKNCIVCHNGSRNPDLREGNSYNSLTTGGYVTLPAEDSRLYKQITSSSHKSLTLDSEKELILVWIQQGAQDN